MAVSLPYLSSNKNIEALFSSIQSAKVPDRFTHDFLSTTIGLKGSNDRAMIPLLRTLGFLDQSGAPTAAYRQLKNNETAKQAMASALRTAYGALFSANENANTLTSDKLKGLVAQVAGTDDAMTARIVGTFNALVKLSDFSGNLLGEKIDQTFDEEEEDGAPVDIEFKRPGSNSGRGREGGRPLSTQFHYNIQVHLPSNATEEVYLNIFNAIRKTFQ